MPSLTELNPIDNLGQVKVSRQTNADKCDQVNNNNNNNNKVKSSLEQATKAQRGSTCTAVLFL